MSRLQLDRRLLERADPTLSDREFVCFQRLLYDETGISLASHKKALVAGRLMQRLRHLELDSYQSYFEIATRDAQGSERQTLIDLLTTNETYFYREPKHFDFLREQVLPHAGRGAPFRVWCAAASSGEEPYTIAFEMAEALGVQGNWDIVASDISARVLARARAACYPMSSAERIPAKILQKFCLRGVGAAAGMFKIDPALRRHVEFKPINLVASLPAAAPFDVIFLRNVMIYFDLPPRSRRA